MHMSAQPAHHASVAAASTKSFEQALAGATLKRVEAKEFVFAEGYAASHVYRVETGATDTFDQETRAITEIAQRFAERLVSNLLEGF